MAGGGANKPWSAVLPTALLVLAVILVTAKAADYTSGSSSSTGSGSSDCKLPSGCDKVLSQSSPCNNPLYEFLSFCRSQCAKAKNECCEALSKMGADHKCASCDLLKPFHKVRYFNPKHCQNNAGKHIRETCKGDAKY